MEKREYLINEEKLLEAGYRNFGIDPLHRRDRFPPILFQKCIYGPTKEKKYYINILKYDWTQGSIEVPYDYSYAPEARFHLPNGMTLSAELIITWDDILDNVEFTFEDMYNDLGCKPEEE